jgi:hypothetical protein
MNEELASEGIQANIQEFYSSVARRLGNPPEEELTARTWNYYLQDVDDGILEPAEPEAEMPEADAFDIDEYLTAQVHLPKGNEYKVGTVLRRKHDSDGKPVGVANKSPI